MDMASARKIDQEGDGPWPLPEGWCWAEAHSFADIVGGGTPSDAADPANFDPDGIPWITPADLSGYAGSTIRKGARSLSPIGVKRSSSQMLPAGAVLISSRAPVGYCVVAEVPVCTNQGFKSLRLKAPFDPFFLRYFVLSAKRCLNDAASGTTFKELSGRAMEQILFPLAPRAEQRRIVARVDALFAEIAEGEAALAAARKGLDTFRRALLKAAVTGELTKDWREKNPAIETGHELLARIAKSRAAQSPARGRGRRAADTSPLNTSALPALPEGWAWATLNEIAVAGPTNGYSPKKSTDGSGTLALKLTATTQGRIDLSDRAVKHLSETIPADSDLFLKPGDLLFQRGNTIEYVGIAAVYEGPIKTYIYPDLMIRVRLNPAIDTEWVWRVANAPYGRKYMSDRATGTAGTMPKISGEILRNFPVPIPPPAEAAEILRRVSEALAAAADTLAMLDAEAADAARLKQSILKAAFEGRLVPQDPADEPASSALARVRSTHSTATLARRGRPKAISVKAKS